MNIDFKIDPTPIFSELFKTQAYVRTLASFMLTEEQKTEFHEKYMKNFKEVMLEFIQEHPNMIDDVEDLKESLK